MVIWFLLRLQNESLNVHRSPKEVVILLDDFKKIEELLRMDLDDETIPKTMQFMSYWPQSATVSSLLK